MSRTTRGRDLSRSRKCTPSPTVLFAMFLIGNLIALVLAGCGEQEVEKADLNQKPDSTSLQTMPSESGNVITLVSDVWLPYNGYQDSLNPGYMLEIAEYAFENAGYTIEYKNVPWTRAINGTRDGTYDGIVATGKDETPDFVFPDIEQGLAVHTFYVNEGSSWKYEGLNSLRQIVLGVIRDYSYGTLFIDYIKPNENVLEHIQVVSGDGALDNNVRKLLAGRIDVLVEDRTVFQYHLHITNAPNTLERAGTYCDEKVYIAFSPKIEDAQDYAGIVSRATEELRVTGGLATILAKYGVQDWRE